MSRTLFIKSFGCQMNVYDSDRMADTLAPLGYRQIDAPEGADIVILNTCHIREKAAEKVYSDLGRLRLLKEKTEASGDHMIIAVAGCVAQAEGAEIMRRAPTVDMIFGPQSYHRLPEMIARATRSVGDRVLDTEFPVQSKFDTLPTANGPASAAAFLTVQEGCDKFCAFCVVPYTRGAEYSRPVADVEAEARLLVDRGASEITLLGQNVNAYHGTGPDGQSWGLGSLIRRLAEIPELQRLRYTTSHPHDMGDDLIAAHGQVPQLMPFIHLPVQSGADTVLATMNRKHCADDYLRLIDRIREVRPDIGLSSDFIVGFPGESDRDFDETMKLISKVGFAQAYSFKYSPRPGTPAASAGAQVDEAVKTERLAQLQELLNGQQLEFNQACVGRQMPILVERDGRQPGQRVGRSPFMQAVHVDAPSTMSGRTVQVEVLSAGPNSLSGRLTEVGTPPGKEAEAAE